MEGLRWPEDPIIDINVSYDSDVANAPAGFKACVNAACQYLDALLIGNSAHDFAESSAGDAQFITDSYGNLLHRTPSASEVAYYQAAIAPFIQGQTPGNAAYASAELQAHAVVLTYFSQSTEFLGDVQITAQHPADAQHWLYLI